MEFETGITKDERATLSGALSKLLADTYVLYLKTQNFHWNIHGPEFYSLHKMSEKQYEDMAEAVDEIAERIRGLGFYVEGSMEAFSKLSSIEEDHEIKPKHVYVENLIKAHEAVIRDCRALGDLAADHSDHGTSDLVGRRLLFHEKASWMLRSTL